MSRRLIVPVVLILCLLTAQCVSAVSAPISPIVATASENMFLDAEANLAASVPSQAGGSGDPHMILLWDGGAAPTGWSLLSEFDGRFFRGSSSYGTCDKPPCGSETHTHTVDAYTGTPQNLGDSWKWTIVPDPQYQVLYTHMHKMESATVSAASNLPEYRSLQLIRYDGTPTRIPAGAIGIFDVDAASLPSGWTRYAAQDDRFVRVDSASGSVGGSNTHHHSFSINLHWSDIPNYPQRLVAGTGKVKISQLSHGFHTHQVPPGMSSWADNRPPYVTVVLAKAGTETPIPLGMIGMFDAPPPPGGWTILSDEGGPLYGRFILPSATYGKTGGSDSHKHTTNSFTTLHPNATRSAIWCAVCPHLCQIPCVICNALKRLECPPGTNIVLPGDHEHTHLGDVFWEPASDLPPYFDVIFAKSVAKPVSVTFQLSGVDADASGSILTIDETGYTYGDLSGGKTCQWYPGSTHSVSANTVPAGVGKRYVWASWTNGDGLTGSSGTYTTPSSDQAVTANYKTQYELTVATDPSGLTPQPTVDPAGPWYDDATPVESTAEDVSGYDFSYWEVDGTRQQPPATQITITMNGPHVATAHYIAKVILPLATIASSPAGGEGFVKVDGNPVATAYYLWVEGSHIIEATSPARGTAQSRYRFSSWSDGLGQSHSITVTSTPTTYTAYFVKQYELTVAMDPSGLSPQPTVNPPGPWYDDGTSVTCTAGTVVGYVFSYWDVDGMPWLIGINPIPIAMDGAHVATAHYIPTTEVTITSSPTGPGFVKVDGIDVTTSQTFIWPQGSSHTLQALSPVSGPDPGIHYVWLTWSDHGAKVHTYITPSSAETVAANYKTQYYLTLETDPPGVTTPTGEGWYDPDTTASISTEHYVEEVPESSRYRFIEWTTADMSEIADPTADSTQVTVDDPKTVTANYRHQSYLAVSTSPDVRIPPFVLPSGPWYDDGEVVDCTAMPELPGHNFQYWEVDGVNQGEGINPVTVTVASRHTATAYYSGPAVGGPAVGGDLVQVNKLVMLSPYLLLLGLIGAALILLVAKRRRAT